MSGFEEEDFKKRFDLSTWKEIFKYTTNVRKTFVLVTIMMIFLAIADTVFPLFTKYAIDSFSLHH